MDLLNKCLEKFSLNEISEKLNLNTNTLKRWKLLNKVPKSYNIELKKILNININYQNFSFKEKDQFFTPLETCNYCFNIFKEKLKELNLDEKYYNYIEPSAGNGNFLNFLPKDRTIALDIEPRNEKILNQDFLNWFPKQKENNIVFGNPPFGLRGSMALKFINHSSKFSEFVCFILPQLFISDGKGSPRKRIKNLNLIHSEKLDSYFLDPENNKIKINTIFQIWSKNYKNDKFILLNEINKNIKIYSLSDGENSSEIRNKKMLYKCDIYLPSTCFGIEKMKWYLNFDNLPNKRGYGIIFLQNKDVNLEKFKNINWSKISFLSTNSAYNLRSSQIYNEFI